MQTVINIPLLPPTLNETLKMAKSSPHKYAEIKRDYTRDCQMCAYGSPIFKGKVWLAFHWYVKTLRRDPADNTPAAAKYILDGFVNAGIIKDDSGAVIQPPIVHDWSLCKEEGVNVTISDRPIYQVLPADKPAAKPAKDSVPHAVSQAIEISYLNHQDWLYLFLPAPAKQELKELLTTAGFKLDRDIEVHWPKIAWIAKANKSTQGVAASLRAMGREELINLLRL